MAISSFDEILVIENEEEAARMLEAFRKAKPIKISADKDPDTIDVEKIKEIYSR